MSLSPVGGGCIFYRWRNFWPTAAPREAGVLCPVRWNSAVSEGESTTSAWRVGQRRIPQPNCCHVLLGCGSKAKGTQARGKSTSFAFEKGFYNNKNKSQTQEEGHSVGGGKPPRHANGNVICYIFITKPKKHGQERKSQISPQRRSHASPLSGRLLRVNPVEANVPGESQSEGDCGEANVGRVEERTSVS